MLIYTGLPELSVMQFSNAKYSGIKNHVPLMALWIFIYKTNPLTVFRRMHSSMILKRNQADAPHHILEGFAFVFRDIRNVTVTTTALKVSR